ncbi:MAG: MarR family winged helix-turn-helix transcriptional regulator [Burkholderiaceae bacterium]
MPNMSLDSMSPSISCTCSSLRKLTRTVTRLYDQHLAEAGLKTTQYSLLKNIDLEPLPIAELAERLSMERTTMTRNLKPLIDAGWVELKAGSDSRQRIPTITKAGRDRIKLARQAWKRAQIELQKTMGEQAVRDLHAQLDTALVKLTPLIEEHANAK